VSLNDQGDSQERSFFEGVLRQNAAWVIAVITVAASVAFFIAGGYVWSIIGVFLLLSMGLMALARTGQRERRLRVAAEGQVKALQTPSAKPPPQLQAEPQARDGAAIAITQVETSAATQAPEVDQAKSSPTESGGSIADEEGEDDLNLALAAAIRRDSEEVDRLLTPWLEKASGDEDPLWRPSLRLQLLSLAGRPGAIRELTTLADDNSSSGMPADRLAFALEQIGETRQAADELRSRLPKITEGRRTIALHEARLRRRLGEYEAALRLCREILGDKDAPSRSVTAALVEEGYCLEATGMREGAFADFEKALEREPMDQDVRFHLAYEYSQDGLREAALAHYLILAGNSPTAISLNNLGAALHDFGLPILGTQRYKEAAAKGEALASGNLAMRLLDVGFVDEALQRIAEGEASEKTNRMVVGAASRIDTEQRAEQAKLEELSRAGGSLREIFKQFQVTQTATLPTGRFKTTTSQQLDLVVEKGVSTGKTDDGAEITLTPKGPLLELGWKAGGLFSATFKGKAIFRDARISGYFKNAKGENIIFIADSNP
jgi:tetratricopeptide (TPR) repeat protein